jgi:type II secretory pathway pseudopilin PulG
MAKLTGPLFSEKAHGTLAGVLTFSARKNVNQVRYQRKQKDYTNTARQAQRDKFSDSITYWHVMSKADQDTFAGYDESDE